MRIKYLLTAVVVLFVVSVWGGSIYAKIAPETCVGMWLFDESGGGEVIDSSGNKHTGTATGGKLKWVDGKFGKALEFSGDGARVHVEHHDAFNLQIFTLIAWVKVKSTGAPQAFAVKEMVNTNRNYDIEVNSDRARACFASGGKPGLQAGNVVGSTVITDEVWHHVAATYDEREFKLYVDGQLEKTQQTSIEPETNTGPFAIGAFPSGVFPINGLMDEVALFNIALEEEDIQTIMNEGLKKAISITAVRPSDKLTTFWGKLKAE